MMRKHAQILWFWALFLLFEMPSFACQMPEPIDFNALKNAELIVVGKIENYKLIKISPPSDALPSHNGSFFMQFDVVVDKFLKGDSPRKITVKQDASATAQRSYLPYGSALLVLLKSSLYVRDSPSNRYYHDNKSYHILRDPCGPMPVFDNPSPEADAVRRVLNGEIVDLAYPYERIKPKVVVQPKFDWTPIIAMLSAIAFLALLFIIIAKNRKKITSTIRVLGNILWRGLKKLP